MCEVAARARALWGAVAGERFPAEGVRVVVAPGSGLCPPGWVGAVTLGGGTLVTAPDERVADVVRRAVAGGPVLARLGDLPHAGVLGPAALAYVDGDAFAPVAGGVERLPAAHPDVAALLDAVGPGDAAESAIDEVTSPLFVTRDDSGRVVAVAGHEAWPASTAHLCVLVHPDVRGRGLARLVASAAVAHALAAGLLPQWRAVPPASRRVALALGFRELGRQLSVRPG
ncbi:GNAT family N-acetyltransferase [Streptomyces sp. NPDC060194]|uniref:GNAT family N-acetyltransferase n=1 Tax=Streptomyces sp. NPDC060194 TaxID=3347069 RepID=UPI00364CAE8C